MPCCWPWCDSGACTEPTAPASALVGGCWGGVSLQTLEPVLEEAFATLPARAWLDRLEAARIPCGAVNEVSDVAEHPQLAHNGLVVEVGSPAGPIPVIGSPFLVDGERPPSGPVPALGEHTEEILRELGL